MRLSLGLRLFLFGFLLAFVILLVSGAPRLISSSDGYESTEIRVHPVQAYLCKPAMQGNMQTCHRQEGSVYNHEAAMLFHAESDTLHASVLYADANGNVIRCASYMRSVYKAFALGDGFV